MHPLERKCKKTERERTAGSRGERLAIKMRGPTTNKHRKMATHRKVVGGGDLSRVVLPDTRY
jgi:hypothetical protein